MDLPRAQTARARAHYTLSPKGAQPEGDAIEARERLWSALDENFSATFRMRLDSRRAGSTWRTEHVIEVLHEGEGDDTTPNAERIDDLVEDCMAKAEALATDGAAQVRVSGLGERGPTRVWSVPAWTVGETLAGGALATVGDSLASSAIAATRIADAQLRAAERSTRAAVLQIEQTAQLCTSMAQQQIELIGRAMALAESTTKMLAVAAEPSVALKMLDVEERTRIAEIRAKRESDEEFHELLSDALTTVIEAWTSHAPSSGGDRCSEATRLDGVFSGLKEEASNKVREQFPEQIWALFVEARAARTVEDFDRHFGAAYDALRGLNKDESNRILSTVQQQLGMGALALHNLITAHEKRRSLS